jgi:hypothetical protein
MSADENLSHMQFTDLDTLKEGEHNKYKGPWTHYGSKVRKLQADQQRYYGPSKDDSK